MEDWGFDEKLTRILDGLRASVLKEHHSTLSKALKGHGSHAPHRPHATRQRSSPQMRVLDDGDENSKPATRSGRSVSSSSRSSVKKSATRSEKDIERHTVANVPAPTSPSPQNPLTSSPPSPGGTAPLMRGNSTESVQKKVRSRVSWEDCESDRDAGITVESRVSLEDDATGQHSTKYFSDPGVPKQSPMGFHQDNSVLLIEEPTLAPPGSPSITQVAEHDENNAIAKRSCTEVCNGWTPVEAQTSFAAPVSEPVKQRSNETWDSCQQDAKEYLLNGKKHEQIRDADSDSTDSIKEADGAPSESAQSVECVDELDETSNHNGQKDGNDGNQEDTGSNSSQNSVAEQALERRSVVASLWKKASLKTSCVMKMTHKIRFLDDAGELNVEEISASSCSEDEDEADNDTYDYEHPHFWLSPLWVQSTEVVSTRKTLKTRNVTVGDLALDKAYCAEGKNGNGNVPSGSVPSGKLRMCMISPNQPPRLIWDFIGLVLFCYDAIVIPLQFFPLPEEAFLLAMSWIVRSYWTADIPLSFLTGILKTNGSTDMNTTRIAMRYLKTWFLFDAVLVLLDWSELVGGMKQFAVARVGKIVKTIRMLRMFRIFKLVKTAHVPEALKGWTLMLRSEKILILFSIMRIIVAMIWVTHFIACFWYAIGNEQGGSQNWLVQHDYTAEDLGYLYTTSFHWSLTLFHGSTDIHPHNITERTYSICALLFAFVCASFAVSSITTSMTQLQIVTAKHSTEMAALHEFLSNNGISKKLAMRVQRSAENAAAELKRNAPETSVELLRLVSEPLRIELHYEMNASILTHHPFFFLYDQACQVDMRVLCHTAIDKLSISSGDMLFSPGTMAEEPKMFFVIEGELLYLLDDDTHYLVGEGQWACEGVLWTHWHHRGIMHAATDTRLLLLDAIKFQRLASKGLSVEANLLHYGKRFVQYLNSIPATQLTDLQGGLDLNELSQQAFPLIEMKEANFKHGTNATSGIQALTNHAGLLGGGRLGSKNAANKRSSCNSNDINRGALRISVESPRQENGEQMRNSWRKGSKQKMSGVVPTAGPFARGVSA